MKLETEKKEQDLKGYRSNFWDSVQASVLYASHPTRSFSGTTCGAPTSYNG